MGASQDSGPSSSTSSAPCTAAAVCAGCWSEELILYAEGRPHRLVGSIGDITEHKRVQEEVIRQREALYRNEKLAVMGSLLAGVAHELNNPLSVIIGQLVLLQETTADQAVVSRAGRI